MKIYFAGSTRNNWRDPLMEMFPDSPDIMALQGLPMKEIAATEIAMLDECDAVLAWFPDENPSGIGLSVEIGYGKARGVPTVLVVDDWHKRTTWLRHIADHATDSISDAVEWITSQ